MTMRPSSQEKRQRILAAAEARFLDVGFDAVTMDDIADLAHVAKQTLYAHFSSKEALFVELVTAITTAAGDRVVAPGIPADATAEQVLVGHLRRQLDAVVQPRALRVRRLVIGELPRFPLLAAALWQHGPRLGVERLATLLADLQQRGRVRIDDVGAAAVQLNWLVMGEPVNAAMLLGDAAVPPPDVRERHVRAAVGVFLAAYGAGP